MTARSLTLSMILVATAWGCGDSPAPTDPAALGDRGPSAAGGRICLGDDGNPLPIAPRRARVDLGKPSFANPTDVTNPLFPISHLERVILLGSVDGVPLRVETTLLAETRTIAVKKHRGVETLTSQYVAFLDGRIHEVALDWYGQADDGAVWYFGEDVFNYEDGIIVDTDGTWLAGKDGPVAMIMPADPKVGNVWRPENICGSVFEEVTAQATGVTVSGPRGPVAGALVVKELHMDGKFEDKIFAPGYGEFSTGAGANLEALALALPTDALGSPTPAALEALAAGAGEIFDAAHAGEWSDASAALATMTAAWNAFAAGDLPPMLETQMNGALERLNAAVGAQDAAAARQAALRVALAALDFELRHRPRAEIDLDLLELWARQLVVDAEAGDEGGVLGDAATLKLVRDRIAGDVSAADLRRIDAQLGGVRAAATARDLPSATEAALQLRTSLGRVQATRAGVVGSR